MKTLLTALALGACSLISTTASAQIDRSFHAGAFVTDDGSGNSVKLRVTGSGTNTISIPAGADATVLLTSGGQTVTGALSINGELTLGAKATSASTVVGDASTTLTTKDYVEALTGTSATNSVILAPTSTARNVVTATGDFTPLTLSKAIGQTADLFDVKTGTTTLASIDVSGKGSFKGVDAGTSGITNAGAISGATGLTSSGTIILSSLSDGIAHIASGIVTGSAIVDADITPATISNAKLVNASTTLTAGTGLTYSAGTSTLTLGGESTLATVQDIATTASPTFAAASFTGKPTAAATIAGDGATTLTTKSYVDAAAISNLTSAVILAPGSSARNVIQSSGDFTPLSLKAASTQTRDVFDVLPNAGSIPVASISSNGAITSSGGLTTSGAIVASGSITSSSTITSSGAITSTAAVSGASLTTTGTVQGATMNVTGNITGAGSGKFAGKVSIAGLNSITISAPNVTHNSTVILTYENTSSPSVGGAPGYFISSYDDALHNFTVVLMSNGPVGASLNYMVIN